MSIRYVVRPKGILTTPRLLKESLNASSTARIHNRRTPLRLGSRDFLLAYPDPGASIQGVHCSEPYAKLRRFYTASKFTQRQLLASASVPVPDSRATRQGVLGNDARGSGEAEVTRYVVRPLRHMGGREYRITSDPNDFEEGLQYISRLYPKRFEYRIIFVLGTPLITLLKRVPPDIDPDGPWNHSTGSYFVTVNDPNNNRLRYTDVVERLLAFDVVKYAHLVAADVLLGDNHDYVVTELNFCPALTIPGNLEKVTQHVNLHYPGPLGPLVGEDV